MKNILILAAFFSTQGASAQERFVSPDFSDFYDWFHRQSQVAQLYTGHSELYTFADNTPVHRGPCRASEVALLLPMGYRVENIAYGDDYYLPEDDINGYGDIWYHVRGKGPDGRPFNGYIWGAQIAKGWRSADLDGDGKSEFVMLGVASTPRKKPTDINAEIRVLREGRLAIQKQIPSLCVFEDCATSPLLRIIKTPQGFTIIEASTMAVGCWAGIEKSYLYWDGANLLRVYHAEYTTKKEMANVAFVVHDGAKAQLCQYSHEGDDYTPVWTCKEIPIGSGRASVSVETASAEIAR